MRLITLFCLMLSLTTVRAQVKYDIAFPFEGHLRELIVSVPTASPPTSGYPVVIMLHGTSGDKDVFYNAHGWKALGEQENFITVFPSALSWCFFDEGIQKQNTKFVCGELIEKVCPSDSADLVDDVAFLREIISRLGDTLSINHEKIFISGFSNGGCMTHKTSMLAGDLFKAAGAAAGPYHAIDSLTPEFRIPIWFIVGTQDDRFIVPPYAEIPFGADSSLFYFNKTLNRALVSQGLTTTYTVFETPLTKSFTFSECQPGVTCAPYRMTLIKALGHQYPNGNNHPFDAPVLFWDFFNNPPEVTTAIDPTGWTQWAVHCSPNPSTDQMQLDLGPVSGLVNLTVMNTAGVVLEKRVVESSTVTLEKSRLGTGMFFIYLESSAGILVKKVIFE